MRRASRPGPARKVNIGQSTPEGTLPVHFNPAAPNQSAGSLGEQRLAEVFRIADANAQAQQQIRERRR